MEIVNSDLELIDKFTFEESFELARYCSILMKEEEQRARSVLINILDNWDKLHPSCIEIWTDLLESAGFYPYLEKKAEHVTLNNLSGELRKELHHSSNLEGKYFHDEQYDLLQFLNSDKNIIVSAPTSFGKSLLIEEVIASGRFKNIVIIQPTLALLDETRRKLLRYSQQYKLTVRTSQDPTKERGNIFLFTAERVNEYDKFEHVDFLVIDEFYKLSGNRDDERSASLNNAFYHILKTFNPKFYLLGPNIDGISPGFAEKYNAVFYKSEYSLVGSKSIDVYNEHPNLFGKRGKKKEYKEGVLFNTLHSLSSEQTIIYCSSPNRVRVLAKQFSKYLREKNVEKTQVNYPIIDWIKRYVSTEWCLIDYLSYDIGIHDGALQKHITTSIIDYFNSGQIKYLFCTSTIIEGVNTSAKNIIYFDDFKGPKPVDYFDYANIKGRAGRMMQHYVGKIFNFNKPPEYRPIIIDIPFFQQNPIKDEVLIQIDQEEVIDKGSDQYLMIQNLQSDERNLIRKNGLQVKGQKSLIDTLRAEIEAKYSLIEWNIPTYRQLEYILELAWDHLLVPGETTKPMTKKKLVKMTFDYGTQRDINYLVNSAYQYQHSIPKNSRLPDNEILDIAVQETFQVMKHWFEYKIPKWLSVMNDIQRFVCSEKGLRPGNYVFYANLIENDFLRQNLSILAEYGIPSSAIRKLESRIPENIDQDLVLDYIKQKQLFNTPSLLEYEKVKLRENIG